LIVVPFAIAMLILDEGRKAFIRSGRGVIAIGSVWVTANRKP
jgi:hypothetical protein